MPAGWARVSFVRDLPDGRRFAKNRAVLYLLNGHNSPSVYANVGATFPLAVYNRLESGFIGFDFHPEFARNGLFYTVHAERVMDNPAKPNFIPPGFEPADVSYHNVITEWRATNPAANTFEGSRRELLRVAHIVANLTHPFGNVEFNPTRSPVRPTTSAYTSAATRDSATAAGRIRAPTQVQRSTRSSAHSALDPRSPSLPAAQRGWEITRFRRAQSSPRTAIPRRSARSRIRIQEHPSAVLDLTDGTMFGSTSG